MRRLSVAVSFIAFVGLTAGCAAADGSTPARSLAGDWDAFAWYAAVSAPPHLAAIAPSAATGVLPVVPAGGRSR
jgi:hypothetical protein